MKIEQVILKDLVIVEEDGEFKQFFQNEKKVACFITNHSLKRGRDTGLIKGSLVGDLLKLEGALSGKKTIADAAENLDEVELQKVIYLGVIGANKNLDLDFDGFLEKYHNTYEETVMIYMNLLKNMISSDPNGFAKALEKTTKKTKKK